jgi:tetratricopeptide (TPR) repeat protein
LHRVISLAEQGLWREATEAGFQEESGAFRGSPPRVWLQAINAAQLGGHPQVLEREGDRLLDLAMSDPDLWVRLRAASALVLVDNVQLREHGGALAASLKERRPELSTDPNFKKAALQALAEYALAARRPAEAEGFLAQDPAFKLRDYLPLKALVKLQEGNRDEAVATLEEAFQPAAQLAGYWPLRVWFLTKLREAEKQITGGTVRSDKLLAEDRQAALADWESRDPATAAFDHLVATYRRSGTPATGPSYPFLARGQRLFELGRLNEAEADFDKAAELAPDDIDTLLARARFHAERGNVARARDEFEVTLNKAAAAKAKEGEPLRLIVEREIARHEAVLNEWLAQSNHAWLRRVRADRQMQLGNWQQAAESLKHDDHFTQKTRLAGLSCLLGDDEGFRSACRKLLEQLPRDWTREPRITTC